MVQKSQDNFAGGILSPDLFGNTGIARYGSSGEEIDNFIVQMYGGLLKRGGGKYLANTKSNGVARLIPFSFNDDQTYILEFTNLLMRVYTLGAIVGAPYEKATPWAEADLFDLNYAQSADVLIVVHPSYDVREIARVTDTNWTITSLSLGPTIGTPANPVATPSGAGTHEYTWAISGIDEDTGEEGAYVEVTNAACTQITSGGGAYIDLDWDDLTGADRYNVYRKESGTGGIYGFVGSSDESQFRDNVVAPDYLDGPQKTFSGLSGADDRPAAVCFFQQRLCFGGTNNNPQKIWFSKPGNFYNFNSSFPVKADDSMSFTLDSDEVNRVKHLRTVRGGLLALTSGEEVLITGGGGIGTPVTPNSIFADIQASNGSSGVIPIKTGNSVLYVQSRGGYARDFNYRLESDGYGGDDLTLFANHLFRGYEIKQWAFSQIPDSVIWAVRDDGVMLSITYVKNQDIVAISTHSTDGEYESVAVIADGDVDRVYTVVKRTLGGTDYRMVEEIQISTPEDVRESFFVDCGLSYDSPVTITGITKANPGVVTTDGAHGFLDGDIVSLRDIVGMTDLNKTYAKVANKTATTFELTDEYTGANIDTSGFDAYVSGGEARKCVTSVSGLSHFPDNTTVVALADGNEAVNLTVTSGAVTIPQRAGEVHVGLPFTAYVKTLPFALVGSSTTLKGRFKNISHMAIQVNKTRGLKVGPNLDTLRPVKERETEGWNKEIELLTGEITVKLDDKWTKLGNAYISCESPLPAQILAIAPTADIGD